MLNEKQSKVEAGPMSVALLDEIAERLLSLEKLAKAEVPEGVVEPLHTITATTTQQVITPPMHKPWFSVSIINDGTHDCWVIVNSEKSSTSPSLVRVGEPCEIDFGAPLIDDLVVWTDAGTASLRIRGVR